MILLSLRVWMMMAYYGSALMLPEVGKKHTSFIFRQNLFFYRKGCEYYVEITGTAVVVNKQDVIFGTNNTYGGKLLLKMVPYYIEYTETGRRDAGFKKLKAQMYDVFMNTLGLSRAASQPRLTELH